MILIKMNEIIFCYIIFLSDLLFLSIFISLMGFPLIKLFQGHAEGFFWEYILLTKNHPTHESGSQKIIVYKSLNQIIIFPLILIIKLK